MLKKILPFTAGAVTACAAAGSIASREIDSPWYKALRKPAIQPPGVVFPFVWTGLYADIAIASAVALDRLGGQTPEAGAYKRALAINLALNTSWSWIFFRFHLLGAAPLAAAALAASSGDLVRRTMAAERTAGIALTPYALWCGFATVLSAAIWRGNRRTN